MTHITSREELLAMHQKICGESLEIMKGKNADYGATNDGLRNFRLCENMMIPMGVGILTRLGDKLARIAKIVVTGDTVVKDETVQDTIRDAINYLVILAAAINEKNLNEQIAQKDASEADLLRGLSTAKEISDALHEPVVEKKGRDKSWMQTQLAPGGPLG